MGHGVSNHSGRLHAVCYTSGFSAAPFTDSEVLSFPLCVCVCGFVLLLGLCYWTR